jgi:hypothetical protein
VQSRHRSGRPCRCGDPVAHTTRMCSGMGILLANGWGVPNDYATAFRMLSMAAAQVRRRSARRRCSCVVGSSTLFVRVLRRRQNDALAKFELGRMYMLKRGRDQDQVEALKWFEASAEDGYALAQYQVGQMYQFGTSMFPAHMERALQSFKLAAQQVGAHVRGACALWCSDSCNHARWCAAAVLLRQEFPLAQEGVDWVQERLWRPDMPAVLARAEAALDVARDKLAAEQGRLEVQRARAAAAKARADLLDIELLKELETQRLQKRDLNLATQMLDRESERTTIVETELAGQQVRGCSSYVSSLSCVTGGSRGDRAHCDCTKAG